MWRHHVADRIAVEENVTGPADPHAIHTDRVPAQTGLVRPAEVKLGWIGGQRTLDLIAALGGNLRRGAGQLVLLVAQQDERDLLRQAMHGPRPIARARCGNESAQPAAGIAKPDRDHVVPDRVQFHLPGQLPFVTPVEVRIVRRGSAFTRNICPYLY